MSNIQLNIGNMQKSRSLTKDLADSLRAQILDGNLNAGDKLPSSKDIEEAAGVSRTVVRESIAVLQAEGLVVSRQGVGVFVAERVNNKLFSIDEKEFSCIHDAIKILELRMAVEIEMAGMAAANRSETQMKDIERALKAVDTKLKAGLDGQKEDFDFHLAIANASGNHYFTRFIEFIGSGVIPARELITKHNDVFAQKEFYDKICNEHTSIADAIKKQDVKAAKKAAGAHLGNSRDRHSLLVETYATK